jgi:hypothetical protein
MIDKKDEVKFSELKVHAVNPFKPEYPDNDFRQYKPNAKLKKGTYVDEFGEVGIGMVAENKDSGIHDKTKFLKLYARGVSVIPELSNSALKFFKYVLSEVLENQDCDYVMLPVVPTLLSCGYKKASRIIYYDTIKELVDKKVIEKKESYSRDQYWINPNMFFNGDRVKLFNDFEEYFKEKKEYGVIKTKLQ